MWKIFCAFLLVFLMAETQARSGDYCDTNNDCDSGECCQILAEYQIVSRKRQGSGENGTCQRYQRIYESCYPLDEDNGYCSCEPGTRCTYHPPPTTTPTPTTPAPPTPPPTPSPPSTTRVYPDTTTLDYPDTTKTSSEDPPCDRKKRLIEEGATFDCQPI